ncbi:MAG TPA: ATP-dependent helicase, partial [Verrucomicrobiae bacterium]|nr:ATP-dependent helicase [Verrucomicrobiae bacterium]
MDKEFQAAVGQLNPAQKQAVEAIDGPVLVVAGPGTGKTQLLSLRVANILQKTDTDPGSILCLTFTNFAATNMRDRLSQLVGPGAHNVMVRTFHSFAAEIMNLYPEYFWNGARLGIAPDTVQLEIIQKVLSELSLDNPLAVKFAGSFTMVKDVQQAIRLAKEAGLTPTKLQAMLALNVAYLDVIEPQLVEILGAPLSSKKLPGLLAAINKLPDQAIDDLITPLMPLSTVLKDSFEAAVNADGPTGKTTQTGKVKRQWMQTVNDHKGMLDERRRNAWWQAVVDVYARYRDSLNTRGYYDYSDMIIELITQLEQHPELLASVQERFLYVLIDEFQDTNAAQLRLAHLVAAHSSTEGKPNLMAVGDDDQSIFAFNGAELNNMLNFRHTYPAAQLIVLQQNYRSSQAILDTARSVIEQADNRLVKREPALTKDLRAATDPGQGTIEHAAYATREHQLAAITLRIQQTWAEDTTQSLAVLARGHDSLRQVSARLGRLQIPIRYEQQNNVLDQELIRQLTLLAELIVAIADGDEPTVNHRLARLLQHPAWHVSAKHLWQLATANYRQPHWLDSLLQHSDKQLANLAAWLLWLAQEASREPLPAMLEYLLGLRAGSHLTSPLRDYFIASRPITNAYLEALSGLQVLRSATDEFMAATTDNPSLADFVRFIRLHQELERPITDDSWFISGERAVQLLT